MSLFLHAGLPDKSESICLVPSETTPRGVRTFSAWAARLDATRFPALAALGRSGECRPFGQLAKDIKAALELPGLSKSVRSVLEALDEAADWNAEGPKLTAWWSEEGDDIGAGGEEGA